MDPADLALRNTTYRLFVRRGRAPTIDEVAREVAAPEEEVRAGWHRLHEAHALVLDPVTDELRMANPFSAVPTAYRVEADGRSWYGNCAWDAFGIGAAMHVDSVIETECADCGEPIRVTVSDARPDREELVFHVLVPAASWWADIGYT
jgi:Alkylmercury lyase